MIKPAFAPKQEGSLLPLTLFALLFISILGVSAVKQTGDQLRMASYQQDAQLAFQAAEAALRHGERLAYQEQVNGYEFIDADWDGSNGTPFDQFSGAQLVAELPRIYITEFNVVDDEARDEIKDQAVYVVTSRATGRDPNTVVILRSYYRP